MLGTFGGNGLGFGLTMTLTNGFGATSRAIEREMASLSGAAAAMSEGIQRSMAAVRVGVTMVLGALISLAFFVKAAKIDAQFQRYQTAFETFTGSAVRAKEVFDQITKDAIANPYFQVEGLQKANMMLISQGMAAEQSMRMVKNLGTVLAGVGGGDAEMNRIAVALEKMKSKGVLDALSERSFIHARLPLIKMMEDAFGKPYAAIRKAGISIDMLDKALAHATSAAGFYGGVAEKLFTTQYAKMQQMAELATVTMSKIGEAIRPSTAAFMDSVITMLSGIMEFVQTPAGAMVANLALKVTLLWGGLGLLAIAVSLNTIMFGNLASILGATAKVTLMNTMATKGMFAAYGQMFMMFIKSIPAMLPMAAVVVSIAGAFYLLFKAYNSFQSLMDGKSTASGGMLGFLQKLGALMHVVVTAFSSYDSVKKQFTVPTELVDSLDALGIGNTGRGLFTWIARFIELWGGFIEGIKAGWQGIKEIITGVLSAFGVSDDFIRRATTSLDSWRRVGELVGFSLAGIALGWAVIQTMSIIPFIVSTTVRLVLLAVQVWTVTAGLIAQAVAWVALNAEVFIFGALTLPLVIFGLGLLAYGFYQAYQSGESAFTNLVTKADGFNTAIMGFTNSMGLNGTAWGNSLKEGWNTSLKDWNPLQPVKDAIRKGLRDLATGMGIPNFDSQTIKNHIDATLSGQKGREAGFDKPGSLSDYYVGGSARLAADKTATNASSITVQDVWAAQNAARQTPTANAAQTMPPLVIQVMLDKEKVGEATYDWLRYKQATEH